jgi:hypothetical protein
MGLTPDFECPGVMCVLHLPYMSRHAHTALIYHVVFATKRRAALLSDANLRWQIGYAAFTVSANSVRMGRKYIRDQKRHHEAMDYRGEMSALKKTTLLAMGLSP